MLNNEQREILPDELMGDIIDAFDGSCTCVDCDLIRRTGEALATALLDLKAAREVVGELVKYAGPWCPFCGTLMGSIDVHATDCKLAANL